MNTGNFGQVGTCGLHGKGDSVSPIQKEINELVCALDTLNDTLAGLEARLIPVLSTGVNIKGFSVGEHSECPVQVSFSSDVARQIRGTVATAKGLIDKIDSIRNSLEI